MFIDYEYATKHLTARANKHVGRKLYGGLWAVFDPVQQIWNVGYPTNWWTENPETKKYMRTAKENWVMKKVAALYPDGSVRIFHDVGAATLYNNWGVSRRKDRTTRTNGLLFSRGSQTIHGAFPIEINPAGKIVPTPCGEKVVDKESQLQLQRKLREVQRLLITRAKLGAFEPLRTRKDTYIDYRGLRDPDWILAQFNLIDPTNLESMESFVTAAMMREHYCDYPVNANNVDIEQAIRKTIKAVRGRIREAAGVVSYVVPTT